MKSNLTLIALLALLLAGQKVIAQSTETRQLDPFTNIRIRDNAKVIIDAFGPQSVSVTTERNASEAILKSENGTLTITGAPSTVHITIPELRKISISGMGSLKSDSLMKSESLSIDISGSGKITLPIEVNALKVDISGSGKATLQGYAKDADVDISGSGKIDAENLEVATCTTDISGVGKCTMDVRDKLALHISGSGTFNYLKEPAKLETHISGIGKYGVSGSESSRAGDDNTYNKTTAGVGVSSNSDGDTTTVSVGNKRIVVISNDDDDDDGRSSFSIGIDSTLNRKQKVRSHWAGFEMGFNTFMYGNGFNSNTPSGYDYLELNSGKSINVNLNLYAHDFPLYKRYVMFTTGIGLTLNNFRFAGDKTLRSDTNVVTADYDYLKDGTRISYDKNKLAVNYFTIPVLVQLNTSDDYKKSFHLAFGVLASYKFNSHLKLVYQDDGSREKTKRQDEFNINPFRFDSTVRLGYRSVTLYASYAMSDLFKDGRGPEVHPFQVGISMVNW